MMAKHTLLVHIHKKINELLKVNIVQQNLQKMNNYNETDFRKLGGSP